MESKETKEYTMEEWLAEGERLFGADKKQWKWKCSNCGHVQSIADFIELIDKKIIPPDFNIGNTVYFSCIGRFDKRIPVKDVGTIFDKKGKMRSPCNYTLGGLFCFANTYIIDRSGDKSPVFDFAEGTREVPGGTTPINNPTVGN